MEAQNAVFRLSFRAGGLAHLGNINLFANGENLDLIFKSTLRKLKGAAYLESRDHFEY